MDPVLKRRTLRFDVRPTPQRPPLGVITQEESEKLQHKHLKFQNDEGYEYERGDGADESGIGETVLPTGALPAVFSPRPIKRSYIPMPSNTPKYFRWKPQPMTPLKPPYSYTQGKPLKAPPVILSPSAQRRQITCKAASDIRARGDDNVTESGANRSVSNDVFEPNEAQVAPWKVEDAPTTELVGTNYIFDGPATSRSGLITPSTVPSVPATTSSPTASNPRQDNSCSTTRTRLLNEVNPIRPSSKPTSVKLASTCQHEIIRNKYRR